LPVFYREIQKNSYYNNIIKHELIFNPILIFNQKINFDYFEKQSIFFKEANGISLPLKKNLDNYLLLRKGFFPLIKKELVLLSHKKGRHLSPYKKRTPPHPFFKNRSATYIYTSGGG